jgi:hypothetical protein
MNRLFRFVAVAAAVDDDMILLLLVVFVDSPDGEATSQKIRAATTRPVVADDVVMMVVEVVAKEEFSCGGCEDGTAKWRGQRHQPEEPAGRATMPLPASWKMDTPEKQRFECFVRKLFRSCKYP